MVKVIIIVAIMLAIIVFFYMKSVRAKAKLKSSEKTIWVNHILDETLYPSSANPGWKNLHGFYSEDMDGIHWWIGIDSRILGIRVQDVVVRFNDEKTYKAWVSEAKAGWGTSIINKVLNDPDFRGWNGSDYNVEFVFRWGGESKSFNVHLDGDRYGEQK